MGTFGQNSPGGELPCAPRPRELVRPEAVVGQPLPSFRTRIHGGGTHELVESFIDADK